jgi:uncharacterized membrane protein YesL
MNIEKLVNSRINRIADWIIRIIMINIMVIASSLLIITIYPAISAAYRLFHDYINGKSTPLFKGYINYFKERLLKKIGLTLLIFILLGIGISNVYYYNQNIQLSNSVFHIIGYFVMISLLAMLYAVILYSFVVVTVDSNLKITRIFKLSFFLAGKYYFRTLLLVITMSIPTMLLFYPQLFFIIVFAGVSIPIAIHALITNEVVYYLKGLGEVHNEIRN